MYSRYKFLYQVRHENNSQEGAYKTMREADPSVGSTENEQKKLELQSWCGAETAAHNFVVTMREVLPGRDVRLPISGLLTPQTEQATFMY